MRGYNSNEKVNVRRPRPTMILAASALLLIALVVAACGQAAPTSVPAIQPTAAPTSEPEPAAIIPSVTVADQAIVEDSVTIAQVVSAGPGWLVVHADNGGKPGAVLGFSAVSDGGNKDVVVGIDSSDATQTLYAMLHSDAGTVGTYEFPGSDGPVLVGEKMVSPAFQITGGLAAAPVTNPTVAVGEGEVELEDFQFVPQVLTVQVGTRVKFSNKDAAAHTVESDTGLFDSGSLAKGEEFFYTFTEAGEYPYYCAPHGGPGGQGMSGTIIVVQAPAAAPVSAPTAAPTAPTSGASPTVAVGEAEVELEDNVARPQILTVGVGTRVKFGNRDAQARIIRSDSGTFTSGTLQKGEEYFYTFTQAGEYLYYSDPGGGPGGQGLSGKIIVVQAGGSAPASNPTAAPTTVGGSPTVAVGEAELELEDNVARPQVLTVKVGTRVKFGNRDEQARVIRSDTGVFTSGVLQKGDEFYYTFAQAGEYLYYSDPGGGPGGQGLSGKVVVVP